MKSFAIAACCLGLTATACAGAGDTGSGSGITLSVAIVSNPQMQDAQTLTPMFEKSHPGIKVRFVSLPENEARAKITAGVATKSGEFDITMISNYETPLWAQNDWLTNLQPYINKTNGYDANDFLGPIRKSLSYKGNMYSVPFYGESSFLMYRKDLFAKAGIKMPAHPTWQQVAQYAKQLNNPKQNINGICLRGDPGWGEVLAPLDTVINTFGGQWYNKNWNAKLDSPAVISAVQFYTNLVKKYGEPGAAQAGFSECATKFGQGNAAMWYDATSAVSSVEDPQNSKVSGKVGYAPAPVEKTKSAGWLYTWSLAIPKTSKHKDAAWQFMSWMTSKEYIKLVGQKLGWARVPPGSRLSTYQLPQYKKIATAFAQPTLQAIQNADPTRSTVNPVPYTGIQFVDIPEFQDLGTRVSQQISAIVAGQTSVRSAMKQSQSYAQTVGDTYRKGKS
jgi:sorbitol/mannitol transport system substrate-binding protein